jgi:hypothetical protein
MQFQLPGRVAPAASALLKIISENFNHPSLGSATLDLLRAVEQEHQKKLNYSATVSTALASMEETLKNQRKQTPDPDPLDNVLNGLVAVVQRLDRLQRTADQRDSRSSEILFNQYGQPAKIKRSDGTEIEIRRDYNKRSISLNHR